MLLLQLHSCKCVTLAPSVPWCLRCCFLQWHRPQCPRCSPAHARCGYNHCTIVTISREILKHCPLKNCNNLEQFSSSISRLPTPPTRPFLSCSSMLPSSSSQSPATPLPPPPSPQLQNFHTHIIIMFVIIIALTSSSCSSSSSPAPSPSTSSTEP